MSDNIEYKTSTLEELKVGDEIEAMAFDTGVWHKMIYTDELKEFVSRKIKSDNSIRIKIPE